MHDDAKMLRQEIDLLVAEAADLSARGVSIRIVHRFHLPGMANCQAGEEVFAALLVHRGREYPLKLPLALRLMLDYLARQRVPQSAAQIELGIRSDDFYRRHAANANRGHAITRTIARSFVRVYIRRLRSAIQLAIDEAHPDIDCRAVLAEVKTVGNEIGYLLRAHCDWVHVDLARIDLRPTWR